jgi:hypothetical protein
LEKASKVYRYSSNNHNLTHSFLNILVNSNIVGKMAKKIEPTPTLYGKDAEAFLASIENVKHSESKQKFLEESDMVYNKYVKAQK